MTTESKNKPESKNKQTSLVETAALDAPERSAWRIQLDDAVARHTALGVTVRRECLAIGDALLAAKTEYERETGSGHGKRNPEGVTPFSELAARALDCSASLIQKYVQIAAGITAEARARIDGSHVGANLTALLEVARQEGPEAQIEKALAIEVRSTRLALSDAAKSDSALATALRGFTDPTVMGAIPAPTPLPANLKSTFPVLASFTTFGDVRTALIADGTDKQQHSRSRAALGPAARVDVPQAAETSKAWVLNVRAAIERITPSAGSALLVSEPVEPHRPGLCGCGCRTVWTAPSSPQARCTECVKPRGRDIVVSDTTSVAAVVLLVAARTVALGATPRSEVTPILLEEWTSGSHAGEIAITSCTGAVLTTLAVDASPTDIEIALVKLLRVHAPAVLGDVS
jgi:hypothetical protein